MSQNNKAGQFDMTISSNQTFSDKVYYDELASYFDCSIGDTVDKLRNFPKFIPHAALGKFLCRYELFKMIQNVHGSIVECGVHLGGGLMTWAQISSILEPINHVRKVIGFDTFEGFADIAANDVASGADQIGKSTFSVPAYADIQEAIRVFDLGRQLRHIPKVELVKGDAMETIPKYIKDNQHLIIALLYMDFDIYLPTKAAIENLRNRMPIGAVIVFDELCIRQWPGETLAVMDTFGIDRLRIRRFVHQPQISYAVLE